jgi:hypothetical protein
MFLPWAFPVPAAADGVDLRVWLGAVTSVRLSCPGALAEGEAARPPRARADAWGAGVARTIQPRCTPASPFAWPGGTVGRTCCDRVEPVPLPPISFAPV